MKLKILNSKEIKEIKEIIKNQWGCDFKTDLAFLLSSNNRIYVVSRDIAKLDLSKLNTEVIGMYFGELKDEQVRLSIEGSQLIGPIAKKNVVEINEKEYRTWLKGYDLEKETDAEGYAIVRFKSDFIGAARIKDGKVLNFVPKNRRILAD